MTDDTTEIQPSVANHLSYAVLSDVGKRREENQDFHGVYQDRGIEAFIVCDGMGGVRGGGVASHLAVETYLEMISTTNEISEDYIQTAVKGANQAIYNKGRSDPALSGMGTTLVGLLVAAKRMFIYSVGDSRAYLVRQGAIQQLTEDHTLVMELLRSGTIGPEQAKNHPVSHMLTRSLGPTNDVNVDCWCMDNGPYKGDRYLMCSDGLYNLVEDEEILAVLSETPIEKAVKDLVDLANSRGGTDNVTVMIVEIGQDYPAHEASESTEIATTPVAPDAPAPSQASETSPEANSSAAKPAVEDAPKENTQTQASQKTEANSSAANETQSPENSDSKDQKTTQQQTEGKDTQSSTQEKKAPPVFGNSAPDSSTEVKEVSKKAQEGLLLSKMSVGAALVGVAVLGFSLVFMFFGPSKNRGTEKRYLAERLEELTSKRPGASALASPTPNSTIRESAARSSSGIGAAMMHSDSDSPARETDTSHVSRYAKTTQDMLEERRTIIVGKLVAIEKKLQFMDSGNIGEVHAREAELVKDRNQIELEFNELTSALSTTQQDIKLWQQKKNEVDSGKVINVAKDLIKGSDSVRRKKEIFEKATSLYLTEVERFKYSPTDPHLAQSIADHLELRKQSQEELSKEVIDTINLNLETSVQKELKLTQQHDTLAGELRDVENQLEFVRLVASGEIEPKKVRRDQLENQKTLLEEELLQLNPGKKGS